MDDLLELDEAAKLARCSPATMAAGLRSGRYPGMKAGRSWVIPRAALIERINEIALEEAAKRRSPRAQPQGKSRRRPLLQLDGIGERA